MEEAKCNHTSDMVGHRAGQTKEEGESRSGEQRLFLVGIVFSDGHA